MDMQGQNGIRIRKAVQYLLRFVMFVILAEIQPEEPRAGIVLPATGAPVWMLRSRYWPTIRIALAIADEDEQVEACEFPLGVKASIPPEVDPLDREWE